MKLTAVLVVAACSSTAETPTTALAPATTEAPSTTSTTEAATTSSTLSEAYALFPSNATTLLNVQPGRIYTYDLNVVGLKFRFGEAGWRFVFVGAQTIAVWHRSEPVAAFVAFRADGPEALVAEIASHEEVVNLTTPKPRSVGGVDGVVFELESVETESLLPGPHVNSGWACGGPQIAGEEVDRGRMLATLVGCSENRVWIGDVDGVSVVVIVGNSSGEPDQLGSLAEIEPLTEEFLTALTFSS
jgi:hypothetical protein